MTVTANAGLFIIDYAKRNWHDQMNNNMRVIDALIGSYFVVSGLSGPWANATAYTVGNVLVDTTTGTLWTCEVAHTSAAAGTFADDRAAHPTYWTQYATAARSRGTWVTNEDYGLQDFVIDSGRYAICIASHTSGVSFDADLALGRWEVLVDGSIFATQALPVLSGAGDGNKITGVNSAGTAYTLLTTDQILSLMGGTTLGIQLLRVSDAATGLSLLGGIGPGVAQPLNAKLTAFVNENTAGVLVNAAGTVSVLPYTATGAAILNIASYAALLTALALNSVAKTDVSNTFAADQQIESTDASALEGPALDVRRLSASAANNDLIGLIKLTAKNVAGVIREMASIGGLFKTVTDAAEDAIVYIRTRLAGTLADRFYFGAGMWSVNATGGDKGIDTINVKAIYDDNVQLLPRRSRFTDTAQTFAVNTTYTRAHGLTDDAGAAVAPAWVQVWMKCVTGEAGYSIGDEILAPMLDGSSNNMPNFMILRDATNVTIVWCAANTVGALNKTTRAQVSLTMANWEFYIVAGA